LSNSCKYACDINPTISIRFYNNTLTITDNGKGMKYPEKIFERSYSESQNGHGIGMHIVHRLSEELNINIQVKSSINNGTTIKLIF
jgi:signal transduction histidine kinase